MEEHAVKIMTESLMSEHGLTQKGWKFKFGRGKKSFGTCVHGNTRKEIRISRYLAKINTTERVRLTALHEIAHALVGVTNAHNQLWVRKCIEIGGDGKRCYNADNTVCIQTNNKPVSVKQISIHNKLYTSGDTIKFYNGSKIEKGEFIEYRKSNHKYPVMVRYNNIIYKMSLKTVL